MKPYKAIFFDWDGTAVSSRRADPALVLAKMRPLLEKGVWLIIISGTTYENICGGKLESLLPPAALRRLCLGLARGNYDYAYGESGTLFTLHDNSPAMHQLLGLHDVAYALHRELLGQYGLATDVCFSRPGYCKIDLMVSYPREDSLFLQEGEIQRAEAILAQKHGLAGGLAGLMALAQQRGAEAGLMLKATTDAKYLELGFTTKSDNVDRFMDFLTPLGISAEDCCFWGDEFGEMAPGIWGSDAQMLTAKTRGGDFFSVSDLDIRLPDGVLARGGSCAAFLQFLEEQEG